MADRIGRDTVDRVLSAWASDHAGIVRALARVDPEQPAEVTICADGLLVLSGPGMYVNAAVACGRAAPLAPADWTRIVERSVELGVTPAIELSATTHPGTRAAARDRGFEPGGTRDAWVLPLDRTPVTVPELLDVEIVEIDEGRLALWQHAAALGFGHDAPGPRSVSDRWAHAALVAGDRMFVALEGGEPVASAILHLTDGVATVGGMSTVPAARGRGFQAAMLRHRIALAATSGAELVVSTAASTGSARNLARAGFERAFTIETWVHHR